MKRNIITFFAVAATLLCTQAQSSTKEIPSINFEEPISFPVCSHTGASEELIPQGGLSNVNIRYNVPISLISKQFGLDGLLDSDYDSCNVMQTEIKVCCIGIKGAEQVEYLEACNALTKYYRPLTSREMVYAMRSLQNLMKLYSLSIVENWYALADASLYFKDDIPVSRPINDYVFGFKIDMDQISHLFFQKDRLLKKGDYIICVER